MRRRMKVLRLQGVPTRLNYSSKDVDEEREMEAPLKTRLQPFGLEKEPITGNIPPLLGFHLREAEIRRRTPSPKRTTCINVDHLNNGYPLDVSFVPSQMKFRGLVAEIFDFDKEEVSKDEEVTHVKVLMALADDELTVGKSHARNGEWVDITIRK
nr:retrovirus-related Pol polyprotein from transposon TNT 1-94 [Tanacetum cinerariifolium]